MKRPQGMGILKLGAALAIILLFVLIHLIAPQFLPSLFRLLASGDIPATVEYIHTFGEGAVLFAFLLTLFTNALGFPPAVIFSTANVILFGIVPGIILSCVAETVGVTVAFGKRRSPRAPFSRRSITTAAARASSSCSSDAWCRTCPPLS